jgi:hypothetical protein
MFPAYVPRVFPTEMLHPSRKQDSVAVQGHALAGPASRTRRSAVASSAAGAATTLLLVPISRALRRAPAQSINVSLCRTYTYSRQVEVPFVRFGDRAEVVDASNPDRSKTASVTRAYRRQCSE